jgi:hypothetical protein
MDKAKAQDKLREQIKKLTYLIVFVLIFEGLMRKMLPSALGLLIFFLKDILCIVGLFLIRNAKITGLTLTLVRNWKTVLIAFIPPLLFTVFHDPVLSIFGLKQYLLFAVVGVLVPLAFPADKMEEFKTFVVVITLALIPTTATAIIQNSLPATHWLNMSVDGTSLEGFAAAGRLRVSSTFSFTGQYSWFLNMVCAFLAAGFFWPGGAINKNKAWQIAYLASTALALLVGTFITGGRSAVLGCGFCLALGFMLSGVKSPGKMVSKGILIIGLMVLALGVIRGVKPEFFAAYDERSSGSEDGSQAAEMQSRVTGGFLGWTEWAFDQDIIAIMFGNGVGLMSNGSEKISQYAYDLKNEESAISTESDFDSTIYEGGIYLAIVWYVFRIWIIVFCVGIWQKMRRKEWAVVVSFLLSYVIFNASLGVIGKNPPANIWLFLVIGSIIVIKNYNDHQDKLKREASAEAVHAIE